MESSVIIIGALLTLSFLSLAVIKGVWLIHMKMEDFNLFWQDWTPMVAWFLLALTTIGGTAWYVIR